MWNTNIKYVDMIADTILDKILRIVCLNNKIEVKKNIQYVKY